MTHFETQRLEMASKLYFLARMRESGA